MYRGRDSLIDLGTILREQGLVPRLGVAPTRSVEGRENAVRLSPGGESEGPAQPPTRLQVDADGVEPEIQRHGPDRCRSPCSRRPAGSRRPRPPVASARNAVVDPAAAVSRGRARVAAGGGRGRNCVGRPCLVRTRRGWEAASVALGPTPVPRQIARCGRQQLPDPDRRSLGAGYALALQPLASLQLLMRGEFPSVFPSAR